MNLNHSKYIFDTSIERKKNTRYYICLILYRQFFYHYHLEFLKNDFNISKQKNKICLQDGKNERLNQTSKQNLTVSIVTIMDIFMQNVTKATIYVEKYGELKEDTSNFISDDIDFWDCFCSSKSTTFT